MTLGVRHEAYAEYSPFNIGSTAQVNIDERLDTMLALIYPVTATV
jgi:hypothetical protein